MWVHVYIILECVYTCVRVHSSVYVHACVVCVCVRVTVCIRTYCDEQVWNPDANWKIVKTITFQKHEVCAVGSYNDLLVSGGSEEMLVVIGMLYAVDVVTTVSCFVLMHLCLLIPTVTPILNLLSDRYCQSYGVPIHVGLP